MVILEWEQIMRKVGARLRLSHTIPDPSIAFPSVLQPRTPQKPGCGEDGLRCSGDRANAFRLNGKLYRLNRIIPEIIQGQGVWSIEAVFVNELLQTCAKRSVWPLMGSRTWQDGTNSLLKTHLKYGGGRFTIAAAGGDESIITTLGWNADPVNKTAREAIFSRDAGL